jgi:glycine cleavage system aminomethyltransferase T/nitrite reductase/ring-hydroxylating ferredoxin subunit
MTYKSLQDKLDHVGDPIEMLRNSQMGPYVYPIPAEFSNWRDEQRAWRETVALMDQSFHMTDLYVEGPDTVKLLSYLGINGFANFGRNKAKQFVVCNHDGYVIGDCILLGLEDDKVNLVGRPPVPNWVQFNAESGNHRVTVTRDERTVSNTKPRRTFRFELQGPNAMSLLRKLNGGPLSEIAFFGMGETKIAGRMVRALRHGMGGAPGLEFWGPSEEGPEIKAAILEAGKEFGLRQVGGRAYGSVAIESGWIPSPLPSIYAGDRMRPYREWLKAESFEGVSSLGGSFEGQKVEDYYFTPWDLDYGRLIRFDRDFMGGEALAEMAKQPQRSAGVSSHRVSQVIAGWLWWWCGRWVLELPLALYRRANGDPVALHNRCPHRWAPLSLGEVAGDDLVCPYHGLQYSPSGQCVKVPTQSQTPSAIRVRAFPAVERHGFVWIWTGDVDRADPALVPDDLAYLQSPNWHVVWGYKAVNGNYMQLKENVLDLTHFAFLHRKSLGVTDCRRQAAGRDRHVGRHVGQRRNMCGCRYPGRRSNCGHRSELRLRHIL